MRNNYLIKIISILLTVVMLNGCNRAVLVKKSNIVKEDVGYLLFYKDVAHFFASHDTIDNRFLEKDHFDGYAITNFDYQWLNDLLTKRALFLKTTKGDSEEEFGFIPVSITYYLGDTWHRTSEMGEFKIGFEKEKFSIFRYKVYDYRNIILISAVRRSDILNIDSLNKIKVGIR